MIAKPFLFGEDRFDSPLEVMLNAFVLFGDVELLAALGGTLNVRVFAGEREQIEWRRNLLSFGIASAVGVAYPLQERVVLGAELSYAYIPTDAVVGHELTPTRRGLSLLAGSPIHAVFATPLRSPALSQPADVWPGGARLVIHGGSAGAQPMRSHRVNCSPHKSL